MPLYKARNYPEALHSEERAVWEKHCSDVLLGGGEASRLAKFFARLGEIAERPDLTQSEMFILEDLQIYGQSIMPVTDDLT